MLTLPLLPFTHLLTVAEHLGASPTEGRVEALLVHLYLQRVIADESRMELIPGGRTKLLKF